MLLSLSMHDDPFLRGAYKFKNIEIGQISDAAQFICAKAYSPVAFTKAHRKEEYFLSSEIIALDFDHPAKTIEEACDYFKKLGAEFIIGTTRNHRKEKDGLTNDRYRVLLAASKVVTDCGVFRANMKKFISYFKSDNNCSDGARLYYPCTKIYHIEDYGRKIAWDFNIAPDVKRKRGKIEIEKLRAVAKTKNVPLWLEREAHRYAQEKRRNFGVFKCSIDLCHMGLSKEEALGWILSTPLRSLAESERPGELNDTIVNGFIVAGKEKAEADSAEKLGSNKES